MAGVIHSVCLLPLLTVCCMCACLQLVSVQVIVGIAALIIVAVMLHFHVKGAFCSGLVFGTFTWWIISGDWPHALVGSPASGEKGRYIGK